MRARALRPFIAVLLVVSAMSTGSTASDPPGPITSSDLGLPDELVADLGPVASTARAAVGALRPRSAPSTHVLVIGTGVARDVFPSSLRSLIASPWGGGDAVGAGTWAAASLLQLSDDLKITSLPVYSGNRFSLSKLRQALDWATRNAADLHAIVYAAPPSDVLDPITHAMANGTWDDVLNEDPVAGARYDAATADWSGLRERLRALSGAGLPVVVPAGDVGPVIQTVLGIATLPEVITVGAAEGRRVARTSASGPALDMGIKPDLVAPATLVGVLPRAATLADRLPADPDLVPAWFTDEEPIDAHLVRSASTVPATAVVAAQLAVLRAGGIDDPRALRGALVAAAEPLKRAPVWRQGAGSLARMIGVDEALARSLPLRMADLGTGRRSSVPFTGDVLGARTRLRHFLGLDADGSGTRETSTGRMLPARPRVRDDRVIVRAARGRSTDAGLFCGTTTVAIPVIGGTADVPVVRGDGLPEGLREHIPTCVVNGTKLTFHGFYIHDEPAESLTHALLPELPPRETVMSGFPKHLPIDPFDTRLYAEVTDAAGDAIFGNVVPGFYRFRQFSDYGSPVGFDVADAATDEVVSLAGDIGKNPSYQDFSAYLLSSTAWGEDDLRATFGDGRVRREKSGAYTITLADGASIQVVLDWVKKMPGPAVSSRYVDLIARDDFTYFLADAPRWVDELDPSGALEDAWPLAGDDWLIEGVNAPGGEDPDEIVATYNALRSALDPRLRPLVTVMEYPFNLTTPNYTMDIDLAFAYELLNAAIVATVRIEDEVASAAIVDGSLVRIGGSSEPSSPITLAPSGDDGLASFRFHLSSPGAREGTLTLLLAPAEALAHEPLGVSRASIDDVTLGVSAWQRVLWPPAMTTHGQGHTFRVDPNVSLRQMDRGDECRGKVARGLRYDECEGWTVLVHTPGSDATLAGVRREGQEVTRDMRAAGAALFDPRRGVERFSISALPHALGLPSIDPGVDLDTAFATNGRFWEQLAIPLDFLREAPGRLQFEIVDNEHGRSSTAFAHARGPAPVPAFVPYHGSTGFGTST